MRKLRDPRTWRKQSPEKQVRRARRHLDLRRTLFLLPNMITLSSVFCGFYSIVLSAKAASEDEFHRAAILIFFAMFFDMLDGRVARATKTQSAFGLQIDSLADVVSFGAAPALLVHRWSLERLGVAGLAASFIFVACGAVRLARFNVLSMDTTGAPAKPSRHIVGLPIPGAAGILVSIVIANRSVEGSLDSTRYAAAILAVTLFLGFLMVSTVRFRSFKDTRLSARSALLVAFVVASSVLIGTQLRPALVLVWVLMSYVALGVVETLWAFWRRDGDRKDGEASRLETEP